jgi:CDP-6-deoxy-D-xylo-4-hexulose-3-dehydrase
VFNKKELELLVDLSLDFWLTTGRYAEKLFARKMEMKHAMFCNSGLQHTLLSQQCRISYQLSSIYVYMKELWSR